MRVPRLNRYVAIFLASVAVVVSTTLWVGDTRVEADNQTPAGEDNDFVVHEWGTFTTFSGSDGVYLDFRPLASEQSDLPEFVLDRLSFNDLTSTVFSKKRIRGRVRMETPVTYFYTDRPRQVSVRVDFPEGMLTEYYPPAKEILPPVDRKAAVTDGELIGNSSIDWGTIDLIPPASIVSESIAEPLRSQLTKNIVDTILPTSPMLHHYGQARETDSALVHVHHDNALRNQFTSQFPTEFTEKFLFYRGVGKFELPVAVEFDDTSAAFVNRGTDPIRSVIMIESRDKNLRMSVIDEVGAGSQELFTELRSVKPQELHETVVKRLIDEGLYEKEAWSMVNTWRRSWFQEEGRRVLYMVPEKTTDELLPLHINPAPKSSLRVLVGRMEMMSPQDEKALISEVQQSVKTRADFLANRKSHSEKFPIAAGIQRFGRMMEPALVRISKIAGDAAVRKEAEQLLAQIRP